MAKPTIVTRASKGSALTWTEGDANFTNLRDATITVSDGTSSTAIDLNGTITFAAGSGISVDETTGTITISNTQTAGATDLDGLSDVQINGTPSMGQVLQFMGTYWENQTLSSVSNLNDLSDVSASTPSAGDILVYNSGTSQWTSQAPTSPGIADVVDDTTPQLGGNLDVNGNSIVSASNGNIEITPDGTGKVRIDGIYYPTTDGTANQVIQTDGAGNLSFGSLSLALDDVSDVTLTAPSNGQVLNYNNGEWVNATPASGGIANVVEDTTPQLGGELDGQGQTISNVNFKDYKETNYALSYGATITPDVANGNVQTVTLTGNVTFNAFANAETGQSLTLIVKQDGTGSRTLSSSMKFAGSEKTLSTAANSIDIISVFYDGTNYYASLAKGFA